MAKTKVDLHLNKQKKRITPIQEVALSGKTKVIPPIKNVELGLSTAISNLTPNNEIEIELSSEKVDNPGRGNCAFYAFAIGLIDLIQEQAIYGNKDIFNLWVNQDPSIAQHWDAIKNYSLKQEDEAFLNVLQTSLRKIAFQVQINELRNACANPANDYEELVASSNFSRFAELYHNDVVDRRFNEFAKSSTIKKEIAVLKAQAIPLNDINRELVTLFLKLMYDPQELITKDTNPKKNSPIVKALSSVTQNSVWGTHLDLDYLSRTFKVNFHTLQDGTARWPFVDVNEWHTITVDNRNNAHWDTQVMTAKLKKYPQECAMQNTKNEGQSVVPHVVKQADKTPEKNTNRMNVTKGQAIHIMADKDVSLQNLIIKVITATKSYTEYSQGIWFSLFHHHGSTGRMRANEFSLKFSKVTDYSEAKEVLLSYLRNKANGNTHPHSYRTMLLNELMGKKNSLQNTSKLYEAYLTRLELQMDVALKNATIPLIF